jgi:isopentenyl phosphate kinase
MKKLVFIKFGGALITDKTKPLTVYKKIIKKIALQIKDLLATYPDYVFVLGNGAGSYGHYYAKKYATATAAETAFSVAITHNSVLELNKILVDELLCQNIPAMSFAASNMLVADKNLVHIEPLLVAVGKNILPIVYGDVVLNESNHSVIFSTETIFKHIINTLPKEKYIIDKIIYVTQVDGVLDDKQKIIPAITKKNIHKIKSFITTVEGYDVTGGMLHKIEESLLMAERNIETYIVGLYPNVLIDCIKNKAIGTKISK